MTKIQMPSIGLGTWQLKGKTCKDSVMEALEMGYRLIDTAQLYGNEDKVGEAIQESGIPREEIVLATKISFMKISTWFLRKSFEKSLKKLQTDYVDILYIHWPGTWYKPSKTLPIFNELHKEGKIRTIGVSNFTIQNLKKAQKHSMEPIFVNQIEYHPFLQQPVLMDYMEQQEIQLVAYSPLARGKVMNNPVLTEIAKNHDASAAQISLAWIMTHGGIPIPKASSKSHLRDNWGAQELSLTSEEIHQIDELDKNMRLINPPFIHPNWD